MNLRSLFIIAAALLYSATAHAADIRISVGEVKDSRTTGQFFSELELKLKLTGDDVPAIRGVKEAKGSTLDTRQIGDI